MAGHTWRTPRGWPVTTTDVVTKLVREDPDVLQRLLAELLDTLPRHDAATVLARAGGWDERTNHEEPTC